MRGAIPPLPNTPLWHRDNFIFTSIIAVHFTLKMRTYGSPLPIEDRNLLLKSRYDPEAADYFPL